MGSIVLKPQEEPMIAAPARAQIGAPHFLMIF
jgi:hypothetical protein